MKLIRTKMNKKGFSLIELIVVIAILAIIAAVAIPRFAGIQDRSTVKSDAATASEIASNARLQHVDNNLIVVTGVAGAGEIAWDDDYMTYPTPQGGGAFVLAYDAGTELYGITWTPTTCGDYNVEQSVTENAAFTISE
ncbi:MAG: prepilin-type N-terminal cleavage/methylation domain-containing protein [Clostridiales bacterium]|nr:prepilin-type N-terminal cleavage/methylation domain-containing protein [Clostridiales bacterium]